MAVWDTYVELSYRYCYKHHLCFPYYDKSVCCKKGLLKSKLGCTVWVILHFLF